MRAMTKELPMPGDVFSVKGHTAFTILPTPDRIVTPTPWVWYAPTLPGLPGDAEIWMFRQFLDAGIAIAGVDVDESCGSPAGRTIYTALHKELVRKRGFERKACLLARSRGGLMLYNWAAENPSSVACIAGIYPVCDLKSYPGLEKASGAYGLPLEEFERQLAVHNPVDRLAALAKARVPVFHIHGDSDTVVPLATNSGEVLARYQRLGGHMILEVAEGQGHNMWQGFFQCQPLVDFVITHARTSVQEDRHHSPDDGAAR